MFTMTDPKLTLKDLSIRLFEAKAIKFGNFTTGSGAVTPVYFDLRVLVSYPSLMKDLSILLSERVQQLIKEDIQSSPASGARTVVCGVPLTAIPITSLVSAHTNIPMILKRQVAKSYGTKQLIEGVWDKGDTCILIDDVIMFGDSILRTVEDLIDAGIKCRHVVVICDRQQGAIEKVSRRGIQVHALLTITEILHHLRDENYISQESCDMVRDYLFSNQVADDLPQSVCNGK